MKRLINIIITVAICFLIGFAGGKMQAVSLETWYPELVKSPLTPPDSVFPVVWSILYLLMGISAGLLLSSASRQKWFPLLLFAVQLLLNFTWSISFFYLRSPLMGFINIIMLDILVAAYIAESSKVSKASSVLFIPYLVWILFATYLNGYILFNNLPF